MAPLGRPLAVGNASGNWQHSVDANRLWVSNLAILGFSEASYLPTHPELARPAAEGALKPSARASSTFIPTSCRSKKHPRRTAGSKPNK